MAIAAHASAGGEPIALREVGNNTTEATVTVDAPPAEIYALVTSYASWPAVLSDVRSVNLERGTRENARVRFRSTVFEHEVTVQFDNVSGQAIRFEGVKGPPGSRASGSFVLAPIDGGQRTRVTARLYLDVVGVASLFVSDNKLRHMREAKLRADMTDVMRALRK